MQSFKNVFFLVIGLAIVTWSFYTFLQKPAPAHYQQNAVVKIDEAIINVEIADTDEERTKGLSGRESLAQGSGMLFIFENPAVVGFWMEDMKFPIDIVWIEENGKVAGVERLVNPDTYPRIFYPPGNIKYVLEIGAGEAQKYGIDMRQFMSYLQ